MKALFAVLIVCGSVWAQPIGPFLIEDAEPPTLIGEAKVAVDASGTAHVFYEKSDSGTHFIMYAALDASNGNIIAEPTAVYSASTDYLFLEDVALTESGIPKFLVFTADPSDYDLILVEQSGNNWTETLLFHDQDGWSPTYGQLSHWLDSCRFVIARDEYTQVVLYNTGSAGGGPILEPFATPVVCFVTPVEGVVSFRLDSYSQTAYGTLRSQSLGADSMYIWAQGWELDAYKYVARSDSTFDQLAYYESSPCHYGELAGMNVSGGDQIHVNGTAWCIPTCLFFQRISGDSCTVIGEVYVFPPMYPPASFAVYENHGFIFPIRDENEVQLLRVDTNATVAASVGTIAWRDGAVQITNASSGVSSNGEIAVVWLDSDPATSAQRLWLASCDWLTPLESRDAPAPLPNRMALSAYPNPFNSSVKIEYEIAKAGEIELAVFNTLGQKVETLFEGNATLGKHEAKWSPSGSSGVYFVNLESGDVQESRKILYLR